MCLGKLYFLYFNLYLSIIPHFFIDRPLFETILIGVFIIFQIPNPLFDLAGITCGHFLVPFWTFFGATLIGKAVIKMHIQKLFVIIAFNEPLVEAAVVMLARVPYIGPKVQEPFKEFLAKQKSKLHRKVGTTTSGDGQTVSMVSKY